MKGAKALLYQVRDEQKEINIIREQIAQAELSLLPSAIRYDTDRVQSTPEDPMLLMAIKIERYETQLRKRQAKLYDKRQKAERIISRLKDSKQRQILTLYFLDPRRLTMQQVADTVSYSVQHTYRIYKAAMRSL